jgi:hypothetical protein
VKLITEYLEQARQFERMADAETDPVLKDKLLKQSQEYLRLAQKRAAKIGQPITPPDTATES